MIIKDVVVRVFEKESRRVFVPFPTDEKKRISRRCKRVNGQLWCENGHYLEDDAVRLVAIGCCPECLSTKMTVNLPFVDEKGKTQGFILPTRTDDKRFSQPDVENMIFV